MSFSGTNKTLLPEYVSCAYISHTHTHAETPDLISARSLFVDKGFPRLRRAAGGKETRRERLVAE